MFPETLQTPETHRERLVEPHTQQEAGRQAGALASDSQGREDKRHRIGGDIDWAGQHVADRLLHSRGWGWGVSRFSCSAQSTKGQEP